MKLTTLLIRNLRNIDEVSIHCGRGIHFIYGLNAQGKTTILESIYLLSNLRSFRDPDASALLQTGKDAALVRGSFELEPGTEAELKVELVRGRHRFEKRAYINQKLSRSAVDYFGLKSNHSPIQFHAVDLNPSSTDLVRGEPSIRRTYLNQALSSENPAYMDLLKTYQKTLDQKNALLKQEGRLDEALFRILNEGVRDLGAALIHARLEYLQKITPYFGDFLCRIAPNQGTVRPALKSGETLYFTGHFDLPSIEILQENLDQKLTEKGPLERLRKSSLVGPHRDDLVLKVGAQATPSLPDLVDVGSQGEIRSVLLALKLAELEEFEKHTGVQPVLLIDDFSSELDSTRRNFLLNYLKDSELQIFVTSTDDLSRSLDSGGTLIQMSQGKVFK